MSMRIFIVTSTFLQKYVKILFQEKKIICLEVNQNNTRQGIKTSKLIIFKLTIENKITIYWVTTAYR